MGRLGSKFHPRRHCPLAIGSPRHMSRSTRQPIPRRFDRVRRCGGRWPRFRGQATWRVGGRLGWAPGGHGRARCHRHHIIDTHVSERARMSALRPIHLQHLVIHLDAPRRGGGGQGRTRNAPGTAMVGTRHKMAEPTILAHAMCGGRAVLLHAFPRVQVRQAIQALLAHDACVFAD